MEILTDFKVDNDSHEKVSHQIATYLRSRIVDKQLKPGDKLPTTQEVVRCVGVGSQTFRQAINKLQEEGLVEASPRRGTFVRQKFNTNAAELKHPFAAAKEFSANQKCRRFRRLAMMGAVGTPVYSPNDASCQALYRPESMAGILKECEQQGILALIFPSELKDAGAEEVYKTLKDSDCQAVIWPGPSEKQWDTIEYLLSKSMPVVATSRSRVAAICACIETDYEQAGFAAGNFLIRSGCDSVLLISDFSESENGDKTLPLSACPYGIRQGITRAYETHGFDPSRSISEEICPGTMSMSEHVLSCLEKAGPKTGPVFTNALQLLDLLKNKTADAQRLLAKREFIVVSNKSITAELAPLMGTLDPMLLIEPFEEIGKLTVQKAVSVIEGYLTNATTLARIGFERFSDLGPLSRSESEHMIASG